MTNHWLKFARCCRYIILKIPALSPNPGSKPQPILDLGILTPLTEVPGHSEVSCSFRDEADTAEPRIELSLAKYG